MENRLLSTTGMNGFLIAAGTLSALQLFGHVTAGAQMFLRPMLEASFEVTAKRTQLALFHFVASLLLLSAISLVLFGVRPSWLVDSARPLVVFIAAQNVLCGAVMMGVAATSGIEHGIRKMFGWAFHFAIAALASAGALSA